MSSNPNPPTDQTALPAKDKTEAQKFAPINASAAGTLDKSALLLVKKTQTAAAATTVELHHLELTNNATSSNKQSKPAETISVKKGETLGEIAKKELGQNASTQDISNLIKEIQVANQGNKSVDAKDSLITSEGSLLIPQHIADVAKPVAPRDINGPSSPVPRTAATTAKPDAPKPVDAAKNPADVFNATKQKELEDDAAAIHKATGSENLIARWADKGAINQILIGKSDAERAAINFYYKKDFKTDLDTGIGKFEKGADFDKFENILHRQDNNADNENARRIHEDLLERTNLFSGRSNSEIEKDIRDTLSSHNAAQIAQMDTEYKKAYNNVSLFDAIQKDHNLSQATKDIAKVYLQKTPQSADQDTKKLIDLALKNKNEEFFAEAMKDASPAARKDFLDNGGEKRVQDTFEHWYSSADLKHAMDYAKEGKLDAATQIEDNTHLINNDQGIELAIKSMSNDDRKLYQEGKTLSTGGTVANLSADDSNKAKAYYTRLEAAIAASGNTTEVAKREDEISSTNGEGSLVSNLAQHHGWLWNDGEGKIDNDIRGMSQADWEDCKKNPERRDQLQAMLGTLDKNDVEIKDTLDLYDKMLSAKSYKTAKDQSQQSVLTNVADSNHWYGLSRDQLVDSIANMSQSEQQRYRTDAAFQKQVDDSVAGKIKDSNGQDAVKRMLDCVKNGKPTDSDVIANLEKIQNTFGTKTIAAANTIEKAFKDDPTLKGRILHPQTEADTQLAQQFQAAVKSSFGGDYDKYGKPYVETGSLPIDLKIAKCRGHISDNNQQITDYLANVTPQERERLTNDPDYRKQTLGFMSADRQKIAMAVVSQGEERPEDKVRAATIGWGGSSDIIADLQGLSPDALETAKVGYATKYGSSLEGDLAKKLGGKEKEEAERIFTQNLSVDSRVNIAKDQTENTRSGFGAAVSDNIWRSGTGAQADNAVDQTVSALTEKNREDQAIANGTELARGVTPEQQQALQQKLMSNINDCIKTQQQATDNNREAKAAAANYVSDGGIAALAIGSMIVTGGASTPLVIGLAVAGAGIKVGTNAALEGNDYDWSVKNVATDAAVGSVTAATSVIGPADIAAVFGVGKSAAEGAAMAAIATVGADTLREGGAASLISATRSLVRDALASGASTLDNKAFTDLAERTIAPGIVGDDRVQAVNALSKVLQQEVTNRMATGIVRTFTQQGLNMAGGAAGGGAGGTVQGVSQIDSRDSFAKNAGMVLNQTAVGSMSGAIGGGVMTAGMKGFGSIAKAVIGKGSSAVERTVADQVGTDMAGDNGDLIKTAAGSAIAESSLTAANDAAQEATRKATEEASKEAAKSAAERAAHDATSDTVKKVADAATKQAPQIQTNPDGRIATINSSRGNTKIEYFDKGSSKGAIRQLTTPDGTVYSSADGAKWKVKNQNGTRIIQGKISASHDGTLSFAETGGKTISLKADGSQTEFDKTGNSIARNPDGKITQTTSSNGSTAKFEYSADGAISRISNDHGIVIEKVSGGKPGDAEQWTVKNSENETGKVISGKSELLPDGSLAITKPSGAQEILRPDSAIIEKNEAGKITRTINARGEESVYTYSKDGALENVKLPDGSEVKKLPIVTRDEQGRITKITTSNWNDDTTIKYEPTGVDGQIKQTIKLKQPEYSSTDGKNWEVKDASNLDGSYEVQMKVELQDNGTVKTTSENGNVREFRGDGSIVDYDKDGTLQAITDLGTIWTRKGSGNWEESSKYYNTSRTIHGDMQETPSGITFKPAKGAPKKITGKDSWILTRPTGKSDFEGTVTIDDNGTITVPTNESTIVHRVDGSTEHLERHTGEVLTGTDVNGTRYGKNVKPDAEKDEFHKGVSKKFDQLKSQPVINEAIESVKSDLKNVVGVDAYGVDKSVFDSLSTDPTLSDRQKANILRNLAEVRQHFASYRVGDRMNPDPEINWVHTQGELGRVMQSARANNLTANEMEDAMLASMYSDSVKFSSKMPEGAKPNFFTHHLDGAIAAAESLSKQGYPQDRIDSIVQAIKEHQIAPPKFMGKLYRGKMQSDINFLLATKKISEARGQELLQTLNEMTTKEPNGDEVIHDIAYVNEAKKVQSADGNWEVDFTPKQKQLLELTGIDRWSVPVDPTTTPNFKQLSNAEQAKLVSNYKIASTLIDGDALDNYATLGGASKIVALRKPGGGFYDPTVWKSMNSVDDSYADAYEVLSPGGKKLADAAMSNKNAAIRDEKNGIRTQMDAWLRTKGLDPAKELIPFYNTDLKYPKPPIVDELMAMTSGKRPDGTALSQADRDVIAYKGLTNDEVKKFKTAQEISLHMRELLLRASRLDNSMPGNFAEAGRPPAEVPWTAAESGKYKSSDLATWSSHSNGDWNGQTPDGRNIDSRDGAVRIKNPKNNDSLEYNKGGLIKSATEGNTTRRFSYDDKGNLTEISSSGGSRIYTKDGTHWMKETPGGDGNPSEEEFHVGKITVDPDGSTKYINENETQMTIERMDGSREVHLRNGRVDYLTAPLEQERTLLAESAESNFKDPEHLQNFNKLQEDFEKRATAQRLTDNQKALLYKQLNRLMADDPNSALPQAQRALLAEQALNHAAHPSTVDQGQNNTCNVTTLEARNYSRNPDKNVQILADIAHSGKFTTDNGRVIDMSQLDSGLTPDKEAATALENQERTKGAIIKPDGARDFSSQITELAMINGHWQNTSVKLLNGKDMRPWDLVFSSDGKLVGGLKKDDKAWEIFDKNGKELTSLGEGQTAYNKFRLPIPFLRQRYQLVYDQQGKLEGITKPTNITRVYGHAGTPMTDLDPGVRGYDANGKEIFQVTKPGEIIYDKKDAGSGPFAKERVMIKDGRRWTPLKEADNTIMDAPNIYSNELRDTNARFSGLNDAGYVLSEEQFKSAEELGKRLEQMKANNELPAVLQVHTSVKPFRQMNALFSAYTGGGGYHVINIHDYDPITKEVKFTNQWGSQHDYMDQGLPLDKVYKSMHIATNGKVGDWLENHKIIRAISGTGLVAGGTGALFTAAYIGYDDYFNPNPDLDPDPGAPSSSPRQIPWARNIDSNYSQSMSQPDVEPPSTNASNTESGNAVTQPGNAPVQSSTSTPGGVDAPTRTAYPPLETNNQ
jgi:YD repeat-containing protein